jgi:threonine aldolase
MRQAGVVAAMGLYAIRHNVERLADDHRRAQRLGQALVDNGFYVPRQGRIDTNIVYFGLPEDCTLSKDAFTSILTKQYGVKVTGGYSDGGRLFRAVTHMDVDDDGIDRAINAIISTANTKVM